MENSMLCAKLLQSSLTFWDPMDCSPPGTSVHRFYRQEYWSCCPPSRDLPDSGTEPMFLMSPALAAAAAKLCRSCPNLGDPIDGSPPGSSVPGILQARTLEWVAISFSNVCKWKVKVKLLSHVWLLVTPWTAAYQAPPSMGFAGQEYWSGVPSPSPTETLLVDFQFLLPSFMCSGASGKEPACQCRRLRDTGLIPETGRSTGVGNGNPPKYSCLGNPMDRRTWRVPSDTTEVT